jgi:hypothetical protein
MKKITVTTVTVVGTDITIVGTIGDYTPTSPSQQTTVGEVPAINAAFSRNHQISGADHLVRRFTSSGESAVVISLSDFSKIGYNVLPALTFAPRINTHPADDSAVVSSNTGVFTVDAASELTPTYQWEESANGTSGWGDITNGGIYAGATSATLTITPTDTTKNGYYYRCKVTNSIATTTTNSAQLTVTV